MGAAANALIKGVDVEDVTRHLDSFYCYHLTRVHYALALKARLEGQAAFLLGEGELDEVLEDSLAAVRKLADRVGDLGGEVTADPALTVAASPFDAFSMPPSNSDVGAILTHALEGTRTIVSAYGAFLERVRGRDDVSHRLVVGLLEKEAHRESDIEAALAGPAVRRASGGGA